MSDAAHPPAADRLSFGRQSPEPGRSPGDPGAGDRHPTVGVLPPGSSMTLGEARARAAAYPVEEATLVGTPSRPSGRGIARPQSPWARVSTRVPSPIFGPPGRSRPAAVIVILAVLTVGLYPVGWFARVNREMGDFDPRLRVRPARSTWAVLLPWFLGIGIGAAGAARIVAAHLGVAVNVPIDEHQALPLLLGPLAVPYLTLLIPFSLLSVAMTLERVRCVEDHVGIPTHLQLRPMATIGWLLLPVFGGLVLLARQQRRLNAVWDLTSR